MSLKTAKQLGWSEGDYFVCLHSATSFSPGSLVQLEKDDGSQCPSFKLIKCETFLEHKFGPDVVRYEYIGHVVKVPRGNLDENVLVGKSPLGAEELEREIISAATNIFLSEGYYTVDSAKKARRRAEIICNARN